MRNKKKVWLFNFIELWKKFQGHSVGTSISCYGNENKNCFPRVRTYAFRNCCAARNRRPIFRFSHHSVSWEIVICKRCDLRCNFKILLELVISEFHKSSSINNNNNYTTTPNLRCLHCSQMKPTGNELLRTECVWSRRINFTRPFDFSFTRTSIRRSFFCLQNGVSIFWLVLKCSDRFGWTSDCRPWFVKRNGQEFVTFLSVLWNQAWLLAFYA